MTLSQYFSDRANTFMPLDPASDVLRSSESKQLRLYDLKRAVILGTTYNQECKIEFVDSTGRLIITISKVIGMSDVNVFFGEDRTIPIRSISRIVV